MTKYGTIVKGNSKDLIYAIEQKLFDDVDGTFVFDVKAVERSQHSLDGIISTLLVYEYYTTWYRTNFAVSIMITESKELLHVTVIPSHGFYVKPKKLKLFNKTVEIIEEHKVQKS